MRGCLITLALLFPLIAFCQYNGAVDNPRNITPSVEFLEDPDGQLTIEMVSSPAYSNRFQTSDRPHLTFGFNESYYWLRFTSPKSNGENLVLELEHAFIPYAELFYKAPGGGWSSIKSGYEVPLTEKRIKDHFQLYPLPDGADVFYMKLLPYLHPVTLNVWNENPHLLHANRQKMVYGVYAGILLFAVVINIFLFFALGKLYYLMYAVLVAFYIAASARVMEGYMIYFFPDADMMFWYKLIPVLNMPALLFYCLTFLEVRKYSRLAFTIILTTAILIMGYIIWLMFSPLLPYLVLNQLLSLVTFVMTIWVGLLIGRRGNRLGYYFSLTYSIWFVLLCIELIYIRYGVPRHIFALSYVSIATFTEALMLAFLQVRRFEWERRDGESARLAMQKDIAEIQVRVQSEIMRARLEMQEQTLQSVSQEIHDNIGQTLSLIKINLNLAHNKSTEEKERLTDSIELLSKAIQDLRELTRTMNTDYIHEIGLPAAIDEQVRLLRKTGAYKVDFSVRGRTELRPQQELLIFRIVQELINNTIKHARASSIKINIHNEAGNFVIEFEDDGCGFDMSEVSQRSSRGLGLNHMIRRAELVGGLLKIDSSPMKGSRFTITLSKDPR